MSNPTQGGAPLGDLVVDTLAKSIHFDREKYNVKSNSYRTSLSQNLSIERTIRIYFTLGSSNHAEF